MPELPEVETVRRTLEAHVLGRRITEVAIHERRLRAPIAADFRTRMLGRMIHGIDRLGKYLLFQLDDAVWVVHLGMTGALTTDTAAEKHCHVTISLSDGTALSYSDPRRFGLMRVSTRVPAAVAALGVDPFSEHFTVTYVRAHTRGRRRPIKTLLMDQRIIAGIGNIYASEILFRARIRPGRRSSRLRRVDCEALWAATRSVLGDAIAAGGSSISDYRNGEGEPGFFQLNLFVYDRAGQPCRTCRAEIRTQTLSGRSSFYCPGCQR